jgi:peptidyl-prolyl cis-trans isomerase A (cyclophilin A)
MTQRAHSLSVAATIALSLAACCGAPSRLPSPEPSPVAPDSFLVEFETSRGRFEVLARRDWSPLGVDRFHDLVRRRVYDDIRVFRVVAGFVAQFGLTGDSAVNRAWRGKGLADEPVRAENTRGRVSYARGGPETRSLQLFINLGNNSPRLDTLPAGGVVGYPPIGEVVRGMETVDSFHAGYGNAPSQRQDSIAALGNAWLDRVFPELDRIVRARVVREWRARGPRET